MFSRCTTSCHEVDHPEVHIHYEDTGLTAQIERWVGVVERDIRDGKRLDVERLVVLDGWPLLPVRVGDHFELHALGLSSDLDAKPHYRQGVDHLARIAHSQHQLADSFGVADVTAPYWLMKAYVCSRATTPGPFLMARSDPRDPVASGWVLRCRREHCAEPVAGKHLAADAWPILSVAELALRRPDLMRFLALPYGSVVTFDFLGQLAVYRLRSDSGVALDANLAWTDVHPSSPLHDVYTRLLARDGSTEQRRADGSDLVTLDLEHDGDLLDVGAFGSEAILCERYGVGATSAKRTLEYYKSREGKQARWRWMFRDQLAPHLLDLVDARLSDQRRDERWRIHDMTARELRQHTDLPFAQLKELVARIDQLRGN